MYEQHNADPQGAAPITLYEIRVGEQESDVFRYTDADEVVYHDGEPWENIAISRDRLKNSGDLNRADFKLTVPSDLPVCKLYAVYPPSYVITVRIFEGHMHDEDRQFLGILQGRILNCEFDDTAKASLSCAPAATSLKRLGLRRNYQVQCPLVLYGDLCRAAKVPIEVALDSVDGNRIVGVPGPGFVAEQYFGGVLSWTDSVSRRTQIRSIYLVEADTPGETYARFSVYGPIENVEERFTILKGCKHTERTCVDWHNNVNNYGGQLWIPLKNPIGKTSVYL